MKRFTPTFFFFGFAALVVLASLPVSAKPPADVEAKVTAWFASTAGGAAVAFVDKDGAAFFNVGQFGPDDARAVTPDTQWEIGSVTKVFTALLLAESERAGKVSRDDPAAKFLVAPDDRDAAKLAGITLVTLTTHTSGLPRMPANFVTANAPDPYGRFDREDVVKALRIHGLTARAGSPVAYSNLGVSVLGEALGSAWGTSYADALTTRVLAPLGLTKTTLAMAGGTEPEAFAPALVDGKVSAHWTFDAMASAGALRSSTRELAGFVEACLGFRETPLAAALAETMKPLRPTAETPGSIGMGWFITPEKESPIVWHNGATGGFQGFVAFSPTGGTGVVVLTNSGRSPERLGMDLLGGKMPAPVVVAVGNAAEFAGSYSFSKDVSLIVAERRGGMTVQLTAQPPIAVTPTATKDRFATVGVAAEVSFERDAEGRVVAMVLHQNGRDQRAPRTVEIEPPAEALAGCVGVYELQPGVVSTVTLDGGRLSAQLTGQPKFPLFASGPDEFFLKVVNAQLRFERDGAGRVVACVLKQNGRERRMPKR